METHSKHHLLTGGRVEKTRVVTILRVWALCPFLLLVLQVSPAQSLPISQPQLHNLDLRMVEYEEAEGEPAFGDDLILEFKSENLSGIVRLNRVEESSSHELAHKEKRMRHGKGSHKTPYDQRGAMYFAVSVVSLYGLSIGVLVAFSLRKDWDEDEVKSFQRTWVKMDHQMEKQEKQRAKKMMTRAIIAIHQPKRGSVCAAVTREAVYMALAPMTLAAPGAGSMDRRPSRESIIWNNLPPPMVTIEEGGGGDTPQKTRGSPSDGSQERASPGPSGYVKEENNNPLSEDAEGGECCGPGESDIEVNIDEDCESTEGQGSPCDPMRRVPEDEEGQFLEEEYLLEGQLEEDLELDSETVLTPGLNEYMGLDDGAIRGIVPDGIRSLRGSKGHESPPSLASPEEDIDLEDEVFMESPTTSPAAEDSLELPVGRVHLGVPSPVLPYMDDEDSSLSWADPMSPSDKH